MEHLRAGPAVPIRPRRSPRFKDPNPDNFGTSPVHSRVTPTTPTTKHLQQTENLQQQGPIMELHQKQDQLDQYGTKLDEFMIAFEDMADQRINADTIIRDLRKELKLSHTSNQKLSGYLTALAEEVEHLGREGSSWSNIS
ncbi:hypothetical protein C8R46DRAFT_1030653 [Mycena filopes]|nr:hypothetical protein C8R46DRAFT_1030653 [Mycena filopes]